MQMSINPKVAIIILNWNGLKDTLECLSSVKKIDYPNYCIIVVDNGSTDGSQKVLRESFPDITIIENAANLGYAEGNNVGIRVALQNAAEYILVLNNDTVVDDKILDNFLTAANRSPRCGIFGGLIYYYSDRNRICFGKTKWNVKRGDFDIIDKDIMQNDNQISYYWETDYVCGAALFIREQVIKKIGLFEPKFFLCWEEVDFCTRAAKAGFTCLIVPNAKIWHKGAVSFNGLSSPFREYFDTRNRLLWAKNNLKFNDRLAVYVAVAKEFFPRTSFTKNFPFYKRLYWDILNITVTYKNHNFKAKILGIRDYIFKRFGNCSTEVLRLQSISRSHKKMTG